MKISKEDLDQAALEGLISTSQAETLWNAFERRGANRPRFDLVNVAYYFGALIVILAMGWFMSLAWERFGGGGIFLVAVAYGVCFAFAGRRLRRQSDLSVPGGLLFTVAVCMTPLAIYGLERLTGIWPQTSPHPFGGQGAVGCWVLMEAATVVSGLIALRYVRFPFLTAPIAFSLWRMSMDLAPLLFGRETLYVNEGQLVSLWFGAALLVVSGAIDRRTKDDYAFWGYLFGALAFWCGLSFLETESESLELLYCLINVGLMILSVLLERRVFIVFGAAGVSSYLIRLAYRVFKGSLMFPFVLSLLGIAIIYLGIRYQRNRERIEGFILGLVPGRLRWVLPGEGARVGGMRRSVLAVVVLLAVCPAGFALSLAVVGRGSSSERISPAQRGMLLKKAPGFALESLDGAEIDLKSLQGKTVLIDFWASWCGPCKEALPLTQRLHEEFREKGVVVLGINSEPAVAARQFVRDQGYTFTTLIDEGGEVSARYRVRGIPATVIIDREGIVRSYTVGYEGPVSEQRLRSELARVGVQ